MNVLKDGLYCMYVGIMYVATCLRSYMQKIKSKSVRIDYTKKKTRNKVLTQKITASMLSNTHKGNKRLEFQKVHIKF